MNQIVTFPILMYKKYEIHRKIQNFCKNKHLYEFI